MKTLAFTPLILPVTEAINDDFGEPDHVNFAFFNSERRKTISRLKQWIRIFYPFFIIIMLSTCGPQPAKQQDLSTLLPKAISKLQRVKLITDSQALEKINSLHGKEITVEAGVIGNYRSAQGQSAMVWISRSKTITLAREQTESMVAKMTENPRSPFHHPETLIIDGITVYRFMGMGQVHYVFRREAIVYWISAPPEEGKNMLAAFL